MLVMVPAFPRHARAGPQKGRVMSEIHVPKREPFEVVCLDLQDIVKLFDGMVIELHNLRTLLCARRNDEKAARDKGEPSPHGPPTSVYPVMSGKQVVEHVIKRDGLAFSVPYLDAVDRAVAGYAILETALCGHGLSADADSLARHVKRLWDAAVEAERRQPTAYPYIGCMDVAGEAQRLIEYLAILTLRLKALVKPVKPQPKIDLVNHALAVLFQEPDISPTELAKRVGVSRSTLYGRGKWQHIAKTLRARDTGRIHRGSKSKDGDLEAEDWPDDDESRD